MSDELIKELSRLQLLSSRCKNKMSMCPLSITLEENRAYLIFNYIKELKEEIRKYQFDRDKNTKFFLNLNDFIKEEIKYCKEIGFECCVEELEKVLKEVEQNDF